MTWFTEWDTLHLMTQIFLVIALPATVLLIIQLLLLIIGVGGADTDFGEITDAADIADGSAGEFAIMGLFTFQGIVAFFCVFGWSGVMFMGIFGIVWLSLILSFALGFAAMWAVAKLIRLLAGLAHSGTLDMKLLIGEAGTVYIPIPDEGTARGKVTVQLAERQIECYAISESGALPANTPVRVTDILAGNVLVVERI